jgi:16S rRNA processing protein RimM
LNGWAHVQAHSEDGEALRQSRTWWLHPPGEATVARRIEIVSVRRHGAGFVAKWQGCDDPETAQGFKGWRVAASRAGFPPLPEGQYYWVDLIGASVVNRRGQLLGQVSGLRNNGAHDLLEVRRAGAGGEMLIPVAGGFVESVDLAGGRIAVDWEADW